MRLDPHANAHHAASMVFGTAELLLMILLLMILLPMPFMTLLHSQRGCREWYIGIRDSSRLQQALFKMPHATPGAAPAGECNLRVRWSTADRNRHLEARSSRLLKPDNPEESGSRFEGYELHPRFYVIIKIRLARFTQPEPYAREGDAHWRSILLCQPPLRELTLGRAGRYRVVKGEKKSPATLGDLYDLLSGTSRDPGNNWRGRELWWDDTVRQSVKTQQKLFTISSQALSAATESGTFDYNGSWGYLFNGKYKEDCDAREPWYLTPEPINDAPAHPSRYQLHPRFHYIFHIWIRRYSDFSQKAKGGWSDPWRSTLLVQPALYEDIVVQVGGRTRRPMYWIVSGMNGAPLTLGDFYDTR
ncbi:hypothetical protein B0A48_05620 [Cryoendolithus antarcticus]|uniref:Uncharacterized protein n=1 Tax=Cryoendolithus antarcticus TaxID=1507870 RepID=A0A1V8TJ88_9PEZI|nr:hypothetical protein B0A48_05620 [Cryoendolithus antarcticus]